MGCKYFLISSFLFAREAFFWTFEQTIQGNGAALRLIYSGAIVTVIHRGNLLGLSPGSSPAATFSYAVFISR